jgi:hypothetical protein
MASSSTRAPYSLWQALVSRKSEARAARITATYRISSISPRFRLSSAGPIVPALIAHYIPEEIASIQVLANGF